MNTTNINRYGIAILCFLTALILAGISLYPYFKKNTLQPKIKKQQTISINPESIQNEDVSNEQLESRILDEQIIQPDENLPEEKSEEESVVETEISTPKEATAEKATDSEKSLPHYDLVIGVISDAHSGQEDGFWRLNSAGRAMSSFKPNIIVDLGDLIESRSRYKSISREKAEADYKKARGILKSYGHTYNAIGNHELLSMDRDDLQDLTDRKNYYSSNSHNGYNIIILDAGYWKNGKEISPEYKSTAIYPGMLPEKQLDWLESKLKNNKKNIIFSHHPLYKLSNSGDVEKVIQKYKNKIILIANGDLHPKTLRLKKFGGVDNYDIPSLRYYSKTFTIIKINNRNAEVVSRKY